MDENNCGPEKLEHLIKEETVFEPACKIHDENYDDKILTQKQADKLFLKHMLKLARNPWEKLLAYIMYALVRLFGKDHYK